MASKPRILDRRRAEHRWPHRRAGAATPRLSGAGVRPGFGTDRTRCRHPDRREWLSGLARTLLGRRTQAHRHRSRHGRSARLEQRRTPGACRITARRPSAYGSPHYTMHRADLQEMLRRAVQSNDASAIRLGARGVGFTTSANGVELALENGERITGDALIGADGIHSVVRQALFGSDQAEFTGFMAWRGLCPRVRRCRRPDDAAFTAAGSRRPRTSCTIRCGTGRC